MGISQSIVRGTLLGGAVGDAMGAPFEGLWSHSIPEPDSLATEFHEYHGYPRGQYTDDTQLTLATVNSLIAERSVNLHDIASRIAELWRHHSVIGPGGACTQAAERFLANNDYRTMGAPIGQAGNGTAMRTPALGLWFAGDDSDLIEEMAAISQLTHHDPRSIAGGVVVARAVNLLAHGVPLEPAQFCDSLAESCRAIHSAFADLLLELPNRINAPDVLQFVASAGQPRPEFEEPIITPYVIPTVLGAIAVVLLHPDSWIDAVTTAIGFGGDADTLGAITGAIAGAKHGADGIPVHLQKTVVDAEKIEGIARAYHHAIGQRHG